MKSTNTKGFTLVELIIVITILAILATIAFISFQGYTKDARNSKRSSDLNSISRSIEVKGAEGVNIINFASDATASLASIDLAGKTGITAGATYKAGEVNFATLGANAENFKDPLSGTYKIGVTTLAGGVYQLASIKEIDGGNEGYVMGTFNQRTDSNSAVGTVNGTTVTLTSGLGLFKKGDILVGNLTTATGEILSISSDLTKLTMGATLSGTTIILDNPESAGLIADKDTPANPVVDGSGSTLPY